MDQKVCQFIRNHLLEDFLGIFYYPNLCLQIENHYILKDRIEMIKTTIALKYMHSTIATVTVT